MKSEAYEVISSVGVIGRILSKEELEELATYIKSLGLDDPTYTKPVKEWLINKLNSRINMEAFETGSYAREIVGRLQDTREREEKG